MEEIPGNLRASSFSSHVCVGILKKGIAALANIWQLGGGECKSQSPRFSFTVMSQSQLILVHFPLFFCMAPPKISNNPHDEHLLYA